MQKRLNRSRHGLGADTCGPKKADRVHVGVIQANSIDWSCVATAMLPSLTCCSNVLLVHKILRVHILMTFSYTVRFFESEASLD